MHSQHCDRVGVLLSLQMVYIDVRLFHAESKPEVLLSIDSAMLTDEENSDSAFR